MKFRINTVFFIALIFSFIIPLFSGCGGGGSSSVVPAGPTSTPAGPTSTPDPSLPTSTPDPSLPTSTPDPFAPTPTPTSQVNIIGNVWTYNPGVTYNTSAGDIIAVLNKSNSTRTYSVTADIDSSSYVPESNVEEGYYRGGKIGEDFNDFLRNEAERLYSQYGTPGFYSSRVLTASNELYDPNTFWVIQERTGSNVEVEATLYGLSDTCYVYIDDNSHMTPAQAREVAAEWNSNSYPEVVSHFGDPTNVDGDSHIYVLFSPELNSTADEYSPGGLYGYFYSRDQYNVTYSNNKDIIYVNSAWMVGGDGDVDKRETFATLAHEFQHMVNFHEKGSSEYTSFNEGMSMMAELYAGYGLPNGSDYGYNAVKTFEDAPWNYSVTSWSSNGGSRGGYGISFLFMCYINDRFGPGAIKTIVSGSSSGGITNIENVLAIDFDILYRDWLIANILDETGTGDVKYRYSSIDMAGNFGGKYYNSLSLPGITRQTLSGGSKTLKPWGLNYMSAGGTGTFSVSGSTAGGIIFY